MLGWMDGWLTSWDRHLGMIVMNLGHLSQGNLLPCPRLSFLLFFSFFCRPRLETLGTAAQSTPLLRTTRVVQYVHVHTRTKVSFICAISGPWIGRNANSGWPATVLVHTHGWINLRLYMSTTYLMCACFGTVLGLSSILEKGFSAAQLFFIVFLRLYVVHPMSVLQHSRSSKVSECSSIQACVHAKHSVPHFPGCK